MIFYYHVSFKGFCALIVFGVGLVQAQTSSGTYRIAVIDGEGAMNNVATRMAHDPVIQVSDANHHPVAGAYVEFDAPGGGSGLTFANGSTHFATTTNSDGIAVGTKTHNNGVPGAFLLTVHVSFRGQSIGETQIHQTNISSALSKGLQPGYTGATSDSEVPGNIKLSNNVVGIALGDQFLVNGASTPNNANLLKGTRIQTLDKPVTLYLHERCEYLVGPRSSVSIDMKMVTLQSGTVRAKRFGDCRILYNGLWVTGSPTSDGVAALTGENLEVASVGGEVRVMNSAGEVISSVAPGTVSSFGTSTVSSGASVGGVPRVRFKRALLLGSSALIALAGLGVATDALLSPAGSGTPTSP